MFNKFVCVRHPLRNPNLTHLNTRFPSLVSRPVNRYQLFCINHFNETLFMFSVLREERKNMYSSKVVLHPKGKEDPSVEESEILIVKKTQSTKEQSLFWALCLTFGPYFLISCLYKFIQDVLMFIGPEILR